MSDRTRNPLDAIERAQEETYFHKKDQALIEAMRQKLERERNAEAIRAETGIADEALITRLAELGVDRDTIPCLHLAPLLQVAWADGEIQGGERDLLLEAAAATGLTEGPARARFEEMLQKRPEPAWFDAALDFIRHMLAALPEGQADAARGNLEDLAWRVADASGGVFGLWGRVEEAEKVALRNIATRLTAGHGDATSKLLDKL